MTQNLDLQAIRQELKVSESLLLDRLMAVSDDSEELAGDIIQSSAGIFKDHRPRNPAFDRLDEERLGKIQAALRRIEDGTFGKCTKCGAEINPERLYSLPYAEFCIPCQRKEEEKLAEWKNQYKIR